jgi:hypothetical protein
MFIGVIVAITVTALAVTGIVTVMAVFSFRKKNTYKS